MSAHESEGELMGTAAAAATNSSRAFLAIFWGGLACGVFDITQAFVAWGVQSGIRPVQILQNIASGLLGPKSFKGGMASASLGAVLHFFIAFSAAAVFYLASRKLSFLVQHPVISGLIYGELVWVFMNFVVVPLSAIHRTPAFTPAQILTGPIGHMFLVGLPIALAVRRYSI
jgi:hypothetical protein